MLSGFINVAGLAGLPEVARGRWKAEPVDPADPLAGELADVLLLEADAAQSHAARDLVRRYLNNERGVVLLVNRATPLLKGFLQELGYEVREGGPSDSVNCASRRVFCRNSPLS